jgi:hypothetical protein
MENDFYYIAKYLLNIDSVSKEAIEDYGNALKNLESSFNNYEEKVWRRMLKNQFLFDLYDSGFSLIKPESPIRKRLFIALAILECQKEYANYFLNKSKVTNDFFKLLILLPLTIFKTFIGSIFVYFKL